MSELKFVETDAGKILDTVLEELESGVDEPLYPGDERRIFGESLTPVVVAIYNSVNDACRQKMLRYARGEVLDALGENRDTYRLTPTFATTTLRFGIDAEEAANIIIPAGTRVTGDFEHYFLTDSTAVLIAGALYVDVPTNHVTAGLDENANYKFGVFKGLPEALKYVLPTADEGYLKTTNVLSESAELWPEACKVGDKSGFKFSFEGDGYKYYYLNATVDEDGTVTVE